MATVLTTGLFTPGVVCADPGDLVIGSFGGFSTGMSVGTNTLVPTAPDAQLDVADFTLAVDYANTLSNWAGRGPVFIDTVGVGSGNVVLQAGETLSFAHPTGPIDNVNVLRIDADQNASIFGNILHNTTTGGPLHLTLSVGGSVYLGALGSFDLNEGSLSIEAGGSVEILGAVSSSGYDIYADGRISTPDVINSGTVNLMQINPLGSRIENGIETGALTLTGDIGNNGIQIYANAVRINGSINAGTLDLSHRGGSSGEAFEIAGDINLANGDSNLNIQTDGRVQIDGVIESSNPHDSLIEANGGLQVGNVTLGGNLTLRQSNPNGSGLAGGLQTGAITLTGSEGHSALTIETYMPVLIDGSVSAGGLNSQPPDLSVASDFTITGNVALTEGTFNTFNIESGGNVQIGGDVTGATFFKIQANGGIQTSNVTSNGLIHFEQPNPIGSGLSGGVHTGSLLGAPEGVLFQTGMPIQVSGSITAGSVVVQLPVSSGTAALQSPSDADFIVTGGITVTGSDPSPITGFGGISIDALGSVRIDGDIDNQGEVDIDIYASGSIQTANITGGGNLSIAQYFPTGTAPDGGIRLGSISLTGNTPGNNSLQVATPMPLFIDGSITADRADIGPANGVGHAGVTITGGIELGDGEINVNSAGVLLIGGDINARQVMVYDDTDGSSFESGAINATERVEISVGGDITVHGGVSALDGSIYTNVGPFGNAFTTQVTSFNASGNLAAYSEIRLNHENVFIGGSVNVSSDEPDPTLEYWGYYPGGFHSNSPSQYGTFELTGNLSVQRGDIRIEHQDGITLQGTTTSTNGELHLQSLLGPLQTGDLYASSHMGVGGGDHPVTLGNVVAGTFTGSVGNSAFTAGDINSNGQIAIYGGYPAGQIATGSLTSSERIELSTGLSITTGAIAVGGELQVELSPDPDAVLEVNGSISATDIYFNVQGAIQINGDITANSITATAGNVSWPTTPPPNTFHVMGNVVVGGNIDLHHNGDVSFGGLVQAGNQFVSANSDNFSSKSISAFSYINITAVQAIHVDGSLVAPGEIMVTSSLATQGAPLTITGGIYAEEGSVHLSLSQGHVELGDAIARDYLQIAGNGLTVEFRPLSTVRSQTLTFDNTTVYAGDVLLDAEMIQLSSSTLYATQVGREGGMHDFYDDTSLHPQSASGPGAAELSIQGNVNWHVDDGRINVDIANATGSAGSEDGWDVIRVAGALNFDFAYSGDNTLSIAISSLTGGTSPEDVLNFDPSQNYRWTLVEARDGIYGFDPQWVLLDTTRFSDEPADRFTLEVDGNSLTLVYLTAVPEPALLGLAGLGGIAMLGRPRRRLGFGGARLKSA